MRDALVAHIAHFKWVYLQFGDMQRSSKNAHERTSDMCSTQCARQIRSNNGMCYYSEMARRRQRV